MQSKKRSAVIHNGNYILYGGGDFAVEVATYLLDAFSYLDNKSTPPISDIISTNTPRIDAFKAILSYSPTVHSSTKTIENINSKQVIICVGDSSVRHRIYNELKSENINFATFIHPSAVVADTAKIGEGSIICPFVYIGPFAKLGDNCALNVGVIVGHDATIGNSSILSPGADINGRSEVGEASFLGAGAIINPGARLGAQSKLSAGSVLNTSTGDGFLMHGNPAKGRQMIKTD